MSGSAKLAPYPYSAKLAGVGVMMRTDPQTGAILLGSKVQPFDNVVGQDYNYSSIPPFLERAYPFRRLVKGMGEAVQQFATIQRYAFADGVDASINGMPMLALELKTVTPATTGAIMGFVEATVAGVPKLLALASRYVLVRNGDLDADWIVSKDLGAGNVAQSAQRFKNNAAGGGAIVEAIYVATDTGKFWQFTGATDTTVWVDQTAQLPAVTPKAHYLTLNTDALIRSSDNMLSTCADDPTVTANWSGPVWVGDASQPLTYLAVLSGDLYIFKTDGVYAVDTAGEPHNLFPSLETTQNRRNGRNAAAWQNDLWFGFGDSFWSLGPNSQGRVEMKPVGVERFIENVSAVRGYVTASDGWDHWFNFFGLYNEQYDCSFLMKLGSWFVDDRAPLGTPVGTEGSYFEPAIHGALATFPGKKITAMKVSTMPGPNERLYIGFDDGTIAWGILPRGTPNPIVDSACRFRTSGTIEWDGHSMNYPTSKKSFRGVTMLGPQVNPIDTVSVGWRVSPSRTGLTVDDLGIYTVDELGVFTVDELGGAGFDTLGEFQSSGQRIDLVGPDGAVGAVGTSIDVQLTLNGNGSSTPWIEGFALHEMLRPDLLIKRNGTVLARDRITRRDGTADWRTADQIRALLQSVADAKGVVPFQMSDGKTVQVEMTDFRERLASEQSRFGNAWDIDFEAVEFATTIAFGTVDRLAGYTVDDLNITVDELGTL